MATQSTTPAVHGVDAILLILVLLLLLLLPPMMALFDATTRVLAYYCQQNCVGTP
jgi:hypothetical protein